MAQSYQGPKDKVKRILDTLHFFYWHKCSLYITFIFIFELTFQFTMNRWLGIQVWIPRVSFISMVVANNPLDLLEGKKNKTKLPNPSESDSQRKSAWFFKFDVLMQTGKLLFCILLIWWGEYKFLFCYFYPHVIDICVLNRVFPALSILRFPKYIHIFLYILL